PELLHKRFEDSVDSLDWPLVDFVVFGSPPGQVNLDPFRNYLNDGGRGLFLMQNTNAASGLARLLGIDTVPAAEVVPEDYALLGKLDRQHPYLQGFNEARFADFTKIHFWQYRKLDPASFRDAKVIGQYVTGDPAWLEVSHG